MILAEGLRCEGPGFRGREGIGTGRDRVAHKCRDVEGVCRDPGFRGRGCRGVGVQGLGGAENNEEQGRPRRP